MARRNILQEIPIAVPQTEQQSYEIVSEDEGSMPYNKQISSTHHPHSRYFSNDESKENITPSHFDNVFKEKSQMTILDRVDVGGLLGDGPVPLGSSQTFASTSGTSYVSTPKRKSEESSDDLQPCTTPMDFSTVTVGDLGISSESFTTKCTGRSPKTLHKHRRRSTIGVRGSPEMNFLIRQIALQKSNRKNEPEPLDNPFTSPRNSLLREKISAFRNAFQAVEETEGKLSFPGFSETEEMPSETGKEEVKSEPPEKRKKVCDTAGPDVSSALCEPSVLGSLPQEALQKSESEKILESDCSLASGLLTEVSRKPVELTSDETQTLPSSSRCRKRKVMFTNLLSPPEPEQSLPMKSEASSGSVLKPALKKTPRREFSHFWIGFAEESRVLFSLQESSNTEENTDSVKKRKLEKKVTFGRELSPEIFDRTLPANTPLRRGSTPYNHHKQEATPSAEQATCQSPCEPMPQPDFDAKDEVETLQPLSLCFDSEASDSDSDSDSPTFFSLPELKEETNPMEEEDTAGATSVSNDNEMVMSFTEPAEETDTHISLSGADIGNASSISPPEVSPARTRNLRSSNRWKLTSTEETLQSKGRKIKSTVKQTRKPMIIIRKLQVKASRGKGKKKGGGSKKSMQKPVYCEREGMSKKPLLSPIPELPECVPTPSASTSQNFSQGKTLHKHLVKEVCTQARTGEVQENNIHFTFEDSLERNIEEKDIEMPAPCVLEDVLEDMKVSNNASTEKSEDLPASEVIDVADSLSSECCQPCTHMEVTDQLQKLATGFFAPSSEEEKKSKTKTTKRHSSTRRYALHSSESALCVSSDMTLECVKEDEDVNHISHKPKTSLDGPVAQSSVLLQLTTANISSEPPLSHISNDRKKSRRSSRIHQVSSMSSANLEQNTLGEKGSSSVLHMVNHPDSSMNDFCLPIDEALQFPQQEKKVRRSMRLRRDSGVIGLSWVQENKESIMAERRQSLSSVSKLEERSELCLGNTVHSPNKENLNSYQVHNIARRTRRKTLCTTTIQGSDLFNSDTKRRRSSCYHKAPSTTTVSNEDNHSTLVPEA